MEKEEEDVDAMAEESAKQQAAACKNRARLQLHKSFLHLSKALKKLHPRRGGGHQKANASGEGEPSSSAAAAFLSGCMHNPRTHSFASGRRHRHAHEDDFGDDALNVNFRSLRIGPSTGPGEAVAGDGGSSSPRDRYSSSGGASEERERDAPLPLPPTPPAAAPANKAVFGGAGVAVVTFSATPYEDFRRSMREMVDAASDRSSAAAAAGAPVVDWDFMEELLFCYLHLNDRAVHRDILRAFTDTVAALRRRRRAAKSRRTRRRGAAADGSGGGAVGDVAPSLQARGRAGA